jgi:hypothetical protein
VIVNSKKALPDAPVLMKPIRAAAPALLPPEAPVYPEEAEVEFNKVVVPLLFPWVTAPMVTPVGTPDVGVAVPKFHKT